MSEVRIGNYDEVQRDLARAQEDAHEALRKRVVEALAPFAKFGNSLASADHRRIVVQNGPEFLEVRHFEELAILWHKLGGAE